MNATTWYRAWPTFNEIVPVDVDKATDSSVWIGGRRLARATDHQSYFPTWDEAHAHLLQRAQEDLDRARRSLERAQGRHGNVKGMRQPDKATGDHNG